MKKLFQSHIPGDEQETKLAWKSALIVFDANTILNLYRYSDKSRTEFISLLRGLNNRIWTPEQAAHEYFNNRSTVIGEQARSYEAAKKSIIDLREALRRDRGHPFIREDTMTNLLSTLTKVEAELDENKGTQISRIPVDEIMIEIVEIFDGRVGERLSNAAFETIFEEGATRYEQKIPPGYKDSSKHASPTTFADKRSVFGDLIVWKQVLEKANELKTPVIFVTDDAKEDWWLEAQGKTIGPRIELLDEFYEKVGCKLYMYRPDQFLKHAKEHLNSEISGETIAEIRATDENRLSEKVRDTFLSHTMARWGSDEDASLHAHIEDPIELRPEVYRKNPSGGRHRNRLAAMQIELREVLNTCHAEQDEIKINIENVQRELAFLSNHLSTFRDRGELAIEESRNLIEREKGLKFFMQLEQERLAMVRERIKSQNSRLAALRFDDQE